MNINDHLLFIVLNKEKMSTQWVRIRVFNTDPNSNDTLLGLVIILEIDIRDPQPIVIHLVTTLMGPGNSNLSDDEPSVT